MARQVWAVWKQIFAMVVVLSSVSRAVADAGKAERLPNILIVYTDDQGYGDFSLQNPRRKSRPRIWTNWPARGCDSPTHTVPPVSVPPVAMRC